MREAVLQSAWRAGESSTKLAVIGGLSLKSELLYTDFGTFQYDDSPAVQGCVQCYSMNVKMSEWILRVGMSYRFDWAAPAPVVARY
ncbi:MAG: hypothetical protein IT537_15480 [Hyphomicrobiales bacterium]|nr:hypothetical protein [Hyphomicrobiales bacterium]